jgi:hypothetical protein
LNPIFSIPPTKENPRASNLESTDGGKGGDALSAGMGETEGGALSAGMGET